MNCPARLTLDQSRRQYLRMLPGFLLAGCGRRKAQGFPGYALVGAAGENTLAKLNLNSFRREDDLKLDGPATRVLAAPDRKWAVAVTPGSGSIHLIGTSPLRRLGSFRLAERLAEVAVAERGHKIVVIPAERRELLVFDVASHAVKRIGGLPSLPVDVDVSQPGSAESLVALSFGSSGQIGVLDLRAGKWRFARLSAEVGAVRFRNDGRMLFVAGRASRSLIAMDPGRMAPVAELPLAMRPDYFSFTPEGGQLFLAGEGSDGIAIIFPYDTLEVEQTVLALHMPGALACSASPRLLFAASRSSAELAVYDVETRRLVGLAETGRQPTKIEITPDSQYALVLNRGSDDMAVIHIPAIHGGRARLGTGLFRLLPVGTTPVDLAVVESADA